jgi:hypothetical protein
MQLMKLGCFALVAGLALGSVGCVVHGHARVRGPVAYVEVDEAPPPPRVIVRETRPGYVYIQGRWVRSGNRWVWRDGHWERQRAGHVWVDGRWERRGNRHVWVEGSWRASSNARDRRDHRDHRRDHHRSNVRDHRR